MARGARLFAVAMALPAVAWAADTEPPAIIHTPVREAVADKALIISATITDASEVFEPTLYYRAAGAKKYLSAGMAKGAGSVFAAALPPSVVTGVIEYFIEAYDMNGNGPSRVASAASPLIIKTVSASSVEGSAQNAAAERDERFERSSKAMGRLRVAGFSLLGAGAAGLAIGGYSGLRSRSFAKDARSDPTAAGALRKYNDARTAATAANIAFAAGGILATAGVVLAVAPWGSDQEVSAGRGATASFALTGAALTVTY